MVNHPPVAHAGPDQTVFVGDTVTLDGSKSSDVDGDLLTFSWSFTSLPDGSTATLSDPTIVNPTFDVDIAGAYVVQLIVNDGSLNSDSDTVVINAYELAPANRNPEITSTPLTTADIGELYTYDVEATDQDGYPLTFSLTQAPTGMTIDIGTGLIEWTPDNAQIGQHDVTVRVEDALGAYDTQSFTITVSAVGDIAAPQVNVTVDPL